MKKALFAILLLASAACNAGTANCTGMYVGRIWVTKDAHGLYGVVLLDQPTDGGGSYWVYFDPSWSIEERKAALALLTGAKLAGHRVDLKTTNSDGCGITSGGSYAAEVFLSNNQ